LKQGMIGEARIDYLTYPAAILVPLRAVQVADVGPRVLVVENRAGKTVALARNIEPISIEDQRILVGAGVQAGDDIIVAGGKGVINGEEVNVIMADGVLRGAKDALPAAPGAPSIQAPEHERPTHGTVETTE